jgi:hypothetical protein
MLRWPPGVVGDDSTSETHNPYTTRGDTILIHLWPKPAPGTETNTHLVPPTISLTSLPVTTVHRSSYERYRMWETTFYCVYDHLTQRSFPAYIDELAWHPHLHRNWQLHKRAKESFPYLSDLVYRPLHTLFYLSDVMRAASPHVHAHAHRLCFRHIDDNPFNNVAPHLHELLVRHISDRQLLLNDGNLTCLFAPETTKWRTIAQHYLIRLPHIYTETRRAGKTEGKITRWVIMTAESKRHIMTAPADNSGMDCKALLQHYATLLPVYITRQSSDLSQPDRCTGTQTRAVHTELVMAPASAHRLFTEESPRWLPDRQTKSEGQSYIIPLPYSQTMQFFAQPAPEFLRQQLAQECRSRRRSFFCYTHSSSEGEDEGQGVDECSVSESQA